MKAPDVNTSPYHRFLGLTLNRFEEGLAEVGLPFRPEFLRADGSDWIHGGILSALIDIAGDYAVWSKFGVGVPTIDLRIDYLRPARAGNLSAVGRVVKAGRTVSIADIELRDEVLELVAVGRGLYASPKV